MAKPRSETVRLGIVAVFHCWNRAVRRAWLCGQDERTGIDYEYRRTWVHQMEQHLASLFAIEIGFHAEMGNHIHVVMRTRCDIAKTWSNREVVRRWLTISKLAKSRDGKIREPNRAKIAIEMCLPGRVEKLRERLSDPSWFMGTLSEYVARRSNVDDGCRGVFWEDRYQCRELTDERAILICGIYVDLNQIRAGEALTPESSTHTSAYDRIQARQSGSQVTSAEAATDAESGPPPASSRDGWLCNLTLDEHLPVNGQSMLSSATQQRASDKGLLPISLDDYLVLLDASGRILQEGKSGVIPAELAPILQRLEIKSEFWAELITGFDDLFGRIVGTADELKQRAAATGRHWVKGIANCTRIFG